MAFGPTREEIEEQVNRIAQSDQFVRSRRLIRFLRFTVDKVLAQADTDLSEYSIATEVYDSPSDFDPLSNGIVRSEVHRLRAKLRDYYTKTGSADVVLIDYPIGSYTPSFRYRAPDFLPEKGVVADRIRQRDWSQTPIGPLPNWHRILKSHLCTVLRSPVPAALLWGQELRLFCNDELYDVLREEHLQSLGEPIAALRNPTVPDLVESSVQVYKDNGNSLNTNNRWMIKRDSNTEERYYSEAFSPLIDDEGAIVGVLMYARDVSQDVLRERRSRILMHLGSLVAQAESQPHACQIAKAVLESNPLDIPFAAIYLLDARKQNALLQCTIGMEPSSPVSPPNIALHARGSSKLTEAALSYAPQVLRIDENFGPLPVGPWNIPARELVVLPLPIPPNSDPVGFLVAGVNPHRPLDADFRSFLETVAVRIGTGVFCGRAKEHERYQDKLAAGREELGPSVLQGAGDQVRTPLTILLSALSHFAASPTLSREEQKEISECRRQAVRVLNVANILTDLGRLAAGDVKAVYSAVDLSELTSELASTLRSATEVAKLRLVVDCSPLAEPVYVDRNIWERIVLTLLLYALRRSRTGEVGVSLRPVGNQVEFVVWHNGDGIHFEDHPTISDTDDQGSIDETWDRSGFNLVLVRQLTVLLGGRMHAEREEAGVYRFKISLPRGRAHLPSEQILSDPGAGTNMGPNLRALMEEVSMLLAEDSTASEEIDIGAWRRSQLTSKGSRRVLLAIQNTELRDYCIRWLRKIYLVETVTTREELAAALQTTVFGVLVADDTLGGIELLRSIRENRDTGAAAVMLLSDRKGEQELRASVPGADDYLVTPFTTQVLLLHVESSLAAANFRRQAYEQEKRYLQALELERFILESLIDRLPTAVVVCDASTGKFTVKNKKFYDVFGEVAEAFNGLDDVRSDIGFRRDGSRYNAEDCPIMRAARNGEEIVDEEIIYHLPNGDRFAVISNSYPIRDSNGHHIATILTIREAPAFVPGPARQAS